MGGSMDGSEAVVPHMLLSTTSFFFLVCGTKTPLGFTLCFKIVSGLKVNLTKERLCQLRRFTTLISLLQCWIARLVAPALLVLLTIGVFL